VAAMPIVIPISSAARRPRRSRVSRMSWRRRLSAPCAVPDQ
jgi:hypothetical protein